ncbi:NAD(P)-binding protein [Rhizodiscina lignyota]|uniref:NAD(P)-binding protein n=1 Tax=Rhizodiscina lignyota TaxID=1504668 RepID=A0A9P4M3I4_9PEZI|nr:NAD(P)-binding protein [Rhizodiscina lignyota]
MSSSSDTTGPVLVTGGCGFLGFHVVQALLDDLSCGPITVVSRNPTTNIFDNVDYKACDITDAVLVKRIVEEINPRVIIHIASPRPMDVALKQDDFEDSNIVGTRNLINSARDCSSTEAFVFSSTVNVIQGKEHINVKEDYRPYWNPKSKEALPYWRSKAEAEKIVLVANSGNLKTASLRLCMVIGLKEHALVPAQLDALDQGKTNIQLGDNRNLLDTVSAENAAHAHLLAMHALLDQRKLLGEIIWRTAGDKTELRDVRIIPSWAANAMAMAAEFANAFIFFSGKIPELNRHVVNFCTSTYTYDISKARDVLGFNPTARTEQVMKEATEWELKRRAQS